jgi:hypothetical protein
MPVYFDRVDIVGVNFHFPQGFQGTRHRNLTIISAYNRVVEAHTTIPPHTLFGGHGSLPVIITGDLNIHHILTQPDRRFNRNKALLSNPYFDEAHSSGFTFANKPGAITRWSDSPSKQDSCINLTFYNGEISNHIQSWQTIEEDTGSDQSITHTGIKSPFDTSPPPRHVWTNTNWEQADREIKEWSRLPPPMEGGQEALERWFNSELDFITAILTLSTPISRPMKWSKKWWTQELTDLRRIFNSASRVFRKHHSPENRENMKLAGTTYFRAINKAQKKHWDNFLSKLEPKSV